ncbi:tetratricopeptide repeat protein [Actinosynnema sp. NPDC023658]|uniref:tetratricopeptide repeat protein n=1 Tax=Actinosynnema sp. NPDC023658 TaxID=3155465 RepID=UPI0033EBE9F6
MNDRRFRRAFERTSRRSLLVGSSAVTLGLAGLLFNLYQYALGVLVLLLGGLTAGYAERRMRLGTRADVLSSEVSSATGKGIANSDARIWTVPSPVRTFTGRSAELGRMKRQMARASLSTKIIALHGMPGLGKTQLAMAYAERHRDSFDLGWWISASSRLWALAGLADLARRLGVAPLDAEQETAAQAAIAALERRSGWLLIFDDVNDPVAIAGLMPNGPGQVIITSRNPAWDSIATTNPIPAMDNNDAIRLLLTHSGDSDITAAVALATELQGLPLAVAQAGNYCRLRAVTLAEYHKRFSGSAALLMLEGNTGPYPTPVTITVELAVEQVQRRSVAAAQLLRLLALLGTEPIPRDLPTYQLAALPRKLAATCHNLVELDRLIEILVSTSLISVDKPGFIRMHGLVQGIIRDRLRPSKLSLLKRITRTILSLRDQSARWSLCRWNDAVGEIVNAAFPSDPGDLALWQRFLALSPHAVAYIDHATQLDGDLELLDALSGKLAAYLHDRGEYSEAEAYFERCLTIRRSSFSSNHPDLFHPMYELGLIAYRHGAFLRSKQLLDELSTAATESLGSEDPVTLKADTQLSFVLYELGELHRAKIIAERVFDVRRRVLGPDHADTLRAMYTRDAPLTELGSYFDEIVDNFQFAFDILQQRYGIRHLQTLRVWHNLCRTQAEAGMFDQAKTGLRAVISSTVETYGPKHPFVLYARHNLARAYWFEGRDLTAAKSGFEEVLAARQQALGIDHPKTSTTRHYLARVVAAQGEQQAAADHLQYVAAARQRMLGADNCHTLLALDDLKRLAESKALSRDGLDASRRFRPDLAFGL